MSEELQGIMDSNPEWYKDLLYQDVKTFIKDNINSATRSFVAIGYYLKHIRDKEMYRQDGYENIWEIAQAEFGISKSQASKFMSINDKFSKNGNSPILLDNYKDFSSSKLSEMLYLTDEQLEQVTEATTVVQIREIRKPEEIVSTSKQGTKQQKPSYLKCAAYDFNKYGKGCSGCHYDKADAGCPYDRTDYFAEIKRQEEWRIHCEVLKEMCDTLCKMMSYFLEKNNYSMDAIESISRNNQEFSFGFGDENGYSKYMARCKSERYYVETFDEANKWIFEAGEVDQLIWNVNGREWHTNHPRMTIDELDLSVSAYNALRKHDIGTVDGLCEHTEKELLEDWKVGSFYTKQIIEKLSTIGRSLKPDTTEAVVPIPEYIESISKTVEIENNKPEIMNDVDEADVSERSCSNCNYNDKDPDEYRMEHQDTKGFPCNTCDEKFCNWEPKVEISKRIKNPDLSCKFDPDARCLIASKESCKRNSDDECMYCSGGWGEEDYITVETEQNIEPDPVETVEADIIQTVPETVYELAEQDKSFEIEIKPLIKAIERAQDAIGRGKIKDLYKQCEEINYYIGLIQKIHNAKLGIFNDEGKSESEQSKPVQPELPILRNNDQRKDFIDAYEIWPIWIDQKETGEQYYRYNLNDKVAMVVKVSRKHSFQNYHETKEYEYGAEQYYLLGIKSEWHQTGVVFTEDESRTFYECSSNKSALVDYMKHFQKRGA